MKIGFIGCGNMGGALARAVAKSTDVSIVLYDKDEVKVKDLAKEIFQEAGTLTDAAECDYVFFGLKPNVLTNAETAKSIAPLLGEDTIIISMAAGVRSERIRELYGKSVIRIMPNTPVAYGEGMILYTAGEGVSESAVDEFLTFMKYAGKLDRISESLIDAGSAVSGCGPAFVYMFIEAMADGGVACGLTREAALKYAEQTVLGAAKVALESGAHPGALKDAVCSPGGSTIEGVLALEDGGMRGTVADAIIAAYEKTKLLGK